MMTSVEPCGTNKSDMTLKKDEKLRLMRLQHVVQDVVERISDFIVELIKGTTVHLLYDVQKIVQIYN